MADVSAKTFDLADMFAARTAPRDTVDTYMNEDLAYQASLLNEEITRHPDDKELEQKLNDLLTAAREHVYVFHIRGLLRHEHMAILDTVNETFPPEKNAFGQLNSPDEADELYLNLRWAAQIEKIVDPEGAVMADLTPETAQILRTQLPDTARSAVDAKFAELQERVKTGYESLVMETDFLSQR